MNKDKLNKIVKVVVNVGVGRLSQMPNFEAKVLPEISRDVSAIVGQKPQIRKSKKSIAGFKLREGQVVGLRATLRGKRSEDFLKRVVNFVLPRVKDFRGLELSNIDKGNNLNFGVREQLVFPEINPETSLVIFGLGITIIPKGVKTREEAIALYKSLGVPLKAR